MRELESWAVKLWERLGCPFAICIRFCNRTAHGQFSCLREG
jgi:hypothetical protein